MPYFFFNIRDGRDIKGIESVELPDLREARSEGIRFSGAILEEEADYMDVCADWRLEVTDEVGLILFVMTFSIMQSSAVPLL